MSHMKHKKFKAVSDFVWIFLTCKSACMFMCKCKSTLCLNMVFIYTCERVITCLYMCVSAVIANMFGANTSVALCYLPGQPNNNYRVPSTPSQWVQPTATFPGGGSDLTWMRMWICGLKPTSLFLWSMLTYNNLIFWRGKQVIARILVWKFAAWKTRQQIIEQGKGENSSSPKLQDNILTWLAN